MYVMVATRPNLAYVVGVINSYMSNPRRNHWEAVKHIFRYLRGTEDVQLTFGSAKATKVEGYTNSNYAGNTDNQKSTSGYIFTYGGGAISWRSKLQECVALSTTKAEDIATSEVAKEAIWLHRLSADYVGNTDNQKSTSSYLFTYGGNAMSWRSKLQECIALSTTKAKDITTSKAAKEVIWLHRLSIDLSVTSRIDHPTPTIYCDSQSAIHLIRNPIYHAKMKHIEV